MAEVTVKHSFPKRQDRKFYLFFVFLFYPPPCAYVLPPLTQRLFQWVPNPHPPSSAFRQPRTTRTSSRMAIDGTGTLKGKILSPHQQYIHTRTRTRKSSIIGVGSFHLSIACFSVHSTVLCFLSRLVSLTSCIRNPDGIANTLPFIPVGWCSSAVLYCTHAYTGNMALEIFLYPLHPSPFPVYFFPPFSFFLWVYLYPKIRSHSVMLFFAVLLLLLFYLYIRFHTHVFQFFYFVLFCYTPLECREEGDTAPDKTYDYSWAYDFLFGTARVCRV